MPSQQPQPAKIKINNDQNTHQGARQASRHFLDTCGADGDDSAILGQAYE
jgi:hypothetical protein